MQIYIGFDSIQSLETQITLKYLLQILQIQL